MNVTFYSHRKRQNSTLRPSGGGTTISFVYKDGSDIHNPLITVSKWDDSWNYALINDVYMYVDSAKRITNAITEVQLSIDVMATYRPYIIGTSAFLAYATSGYDENLPDERFSPSPVTDLVHSYVDFPLFNTSPTLILSVFGVPQVTSAYSGMTQTFAILASQCRQLAQQLATASDDVIQELAKIFSAPYQSIIGMKLISADISQAVGGNSNVVLGNYNTGISAATISQRIITGDVDIPIPWLYGDWRDAEPYCALHIYVPPFGVVDVSVSECWHIDKLVLHYCLDVCTGDLAFQLKCSAQQSNAILSSFQTTVGTDIPIGQTSNGMVGVVNSIIGMATSGANPLAIATNSFHGMISGLQQFTTTRGQLGGLAGAMIDNRIAVSMIGHQPTLYNPGATLGRPVGHVGIISSGYVQTVGASVSAPAYAGEISAINYMLDGGAYIQ